MYLALKANKIESIQFLLARQLPVWYKGAQPDKLDNSPIFQAIKLKNMAAIEIFCDRNTEEMNYAVDSHGNNVIMYAAEIGNFEVVNYLSARGVQLDVEDR